MKRWEGIVGPDIYYNRVRFYDPTLGRLLAKDPLGYGGGDSNLYSFAWNNPKNWSDPSGLSAAAELFRHTAPSIAHLTLDGPDGGPRGPQHRKRR